ncbi:hypothetical protein [Bradyrhizobium sp. SZCCHNS1012]|uniref:hypothetical protein n=1 Tax=Bradyrhizobium sp. SZCCHNS1012 TaxID=3057297 RepID=UPI0029165EF5|nr:hypothetical protein [Bradyrhizobium sp. SZCCHNS1012]
MGEVIDFNSQPSTERPTLKCCGAGRDAENDKALCFYFSRKPTDDEMRFLHAVMQRAAACVGV